MVYGIYDKSFNLILKCIKDTGQVKKIILFGSRAMGNYKKGSDIDIAIQGDNVDYNTITEINTTLNQKLEIPYHVDIVYYNQINNIELKKHIDTFGKTLFNEK